MNIDNSKQKILIVHNYYQIPGGEDTVVANEMKMLEEHGHEVTLYSRNNAELKEMSKLQKLGLPFTTVFNNRTYKEAKKIIKEKHIDIVHVHNTLNLISPAVYYAARSCKVPIVQTVHNFRLLCPSATFYRDGHICEDCVEKGLACAVKYSCYRGSKVQTLACVVSTKIHRMIGIYRKLNYICLTDFNMEKLISLKHIKSDKIFVKPNFVESNKSVIPYKQRKSQFIYAGRLDKLKGVDILLQAWKQIETEQKADAPKLVICGTGPMEDWCREYIKKNGLQSVEMMGIISNIETRKIIAISKALILPTQWYEGFPMTIVEAYGAGTPVIGSDIGNVGSLIQDGVTGYKFTHDSVNELKNAVAMNLDIIDSIYKIYRENYTMESNYERLSEIYGIVLNKGGKRQL